MQDKHLIKSYDFATILHPELNMKASCQVVVCKIEES
jgi:hypothetical protein